MFNILNADNGAQKNQQITLFPVNEIFTYNSSHSVCVTHPSLTVPFANTYSCRLTRYAHTASEVHTHAYIVINIIITIHINVLVGATPQLLHFTSDAKPYADSTPSSAIQRTSHTIKLHTIAE